MAYQVADFWENNSGKIQCTLCPHHCLLEEGQSGICMVRSVKNNKLRSMVYGYPFAQHIDPIEKKPLYHFLPASKTYSIGTQGCNLKCKFCQNWHLSTQFSQTDNYYSPNEIVERAIESQCESISFTYNEPIVFAEYLMDIRDIALGKGLASVLVTNAYIDPEARKEVFKGINAVNIDLKAFSNEVYQKYTGAKLEPVLDTIKWCINNDIHTEISTLIIPGVNDDPDIFEKQCHWLLENCGENLAFHINAFYPAYKMINYPSTSQAILKKCKIIAENTGLKYVYIGNYPGFDNNTYCANCHEPIILRKGYDIHVKKHNKQQSPLVWSIK